MKEKNGLSALSLLIIRSILFKNQLKYFHEYSAFIDNSKENKKKKKKQLTERSTTLYIRNFREKTQERI